MVALKLAREAGQHEDDNIADAAGYLSLIPEIRMYENPNRAQAVPVDCGDAGFITPQKTYAGL
jgi:hypothetical protein